MNIKVEITQEDIDNGVAHTTLCPIFFALKKIMEHDIISVYREIIQTTSKASEAVYIHDGQKFFDDFKYGKVVHPTIITLRKLSGYNFITNTFDKPN